MPRLTLWIAAITGLGLGLLFGYHAGRWHRAYHLLLSLKASPRQEAERSATAGPLQQELVLPLREGPTQARFYFPSGRGRHAVVLGHGVHFRGIDEPRLVAFARHLASSGLVVLTPKLSDLTDYRVTAQAARILAQSASWLAARNAEERSQRVGIIGFSFAGGMALMAATEPSLRDRLSYVVSVGGHHDLKRTLLYLLTDQEQTPSGMRTRLAHDYGLIILALQYVDELVPKQSQEQARVVLKAWLQEERALAVALASERTSIAAERLYALLFAENLEEYRTQLEQRLIRESSALAELSPKHHLGRLNTRVFLLHGASDNVIPPSETHWAALELREERGRLWQAPWPLGSGRSLITPLLDHVSVGPDPPQAEQFALLDFMAQLF